MLKFCFCFSLADQLLHVDILDMAAAYKFEVQRYRLSSEKEGEVNDEEVTVAMMADLQEEQDKESAGVLGNLQEKVGGTREKTVNCYFTSYCLLPNTEKALKKAKSLIENRQDTRAQIPFPTSLLMVYAGDFIKAGKGRGQEGEGISDSSE